jgi:hypothetical protein
VAEENERIGMDEASQRRHRHYLKLMEYLRTHIPNGEYIPLMSVSNECTDVYTIVHLSYTYPGYARKYKVSDTTIEPIT